MIVRRIVGLILLACWASVAAAQGTGRIEGRVVNQGKGVPGVAVRVLKLDGIVFSGEDGAFVIDDVPAGGQTLLLSFGEDQMPRIINVTAGEPTTVEIEVEWEAGGYEEVKVIAGMERLEAIVDAPAAETEVTEEEIEKQASHGQLPKVLEYTPGAEVTQSGLYDFNFNTRGFNSSLNRRVSTYIDGRDVGVPLLGAQEWGALSIPLDDLGELKFIRGPSAALYGANASSGVVKMSTRPPRDSEGGTFRATVGEIDTLNGDVRWADEIGRGWYYKLLAGIRDTGDFAVSRDPCPDFSGSCPGGILPEPPPPEYDNFCFKVGETDCLLQERELLRENDNEIYFGSLRVDKYLTESSYITIETATTHIEGPVFQTGIGRVQIVETDRPWARVAYSSDRWKILGHFAKRDGHQVNLAKGLKGDFDLFTDTLRYGVEARGDWKFADERIELAVGAAYTEEDIDSEDPETGRQTVVIEPIKTDRQALFSQINWKVTDAVKLVFAGRVDWNTLHDTQFSPKAALVYEFSPKHSTRVTYNEAFQVANYSEFFLSTRIESFPLLGFAQVICGAAGFTAEDCGITDNAPILAVGNDDLLLEETRSWEVGYTGILGNRTFLTVDYYNSENENFITDLMPQIGTSLSVPVPGEEEPKINPDYKLWEGTQIAKENFLVPGVLTLEQAIINAVDQQVGFLPFGMQLAQDKLDGSTVVVGRTYANVGRVDTQGVDFGFQFHYNNNWKVHGSYSWFDFEIVQGAPDVQDLLLPNSPEHKASLGVSYTTGVWDASIAGRWVDDFRWSAGVFQGDVSAYSTIDLNANWTVHRRVRLGLSVANAADHVHRQTFGGDLLRRRALGHVTYFW